MIRRMRHWLAHRLGWNGGRVVSWTDRHGAVWVAFRCSGCGSYFGAHIVLPAAPSAARAREEGQG